MATFKASKDCIHSVRFSHDSAFVATSDADNCIGVYRHGSGVEDGMQRTWELLGKYRSHYKMIIGLQFGALRPRHSSLPLTVGESCLHWASHIPSDLSLY